MRLGSPASTHLRAGLDTTKRPARPRAMEVWLLGASAVTALAALGQIITSPGFDEEKPYWIVLVHVPATWTALSLFALFVAMSCLGLVRSRQVASMVAEAVAPTGALFTLLSLWTGSLWRRAQHAPWWAWDAPHLVNLTLLVVFSACILLWDALDDFRACDRVVAALSILGAGVVLGLLGSVEVLPRALPHPDGRLPWTRLTLALTGITASLMLYAASVGLQRLRCVVLERDRARKAADGRQEWP